MQSEEDLGASPQVPGPLLAGHTPTPWRAVKTPHGPIDIFDSRNRDIVTVYGGGVGREQMEANAAFIVLACNLHHEMKEALEEIALGRGPFKIDPHEHAISVIDAMKEVARAVLAKLQGA